MRRRRWQIILPTIGLLLFAFDTYSAHERLNRETKPGTRRYFYWMGIRLDHHPLKIEAPKVPQSGNPDEVGWDPVYIHVELSPIERLLILTGLPAFFVSLPLVHALDRFGTDEVAVFLPALATALTAWYWFFGWLIDRRRTEKALKLRR